MAFLQIKSNSIYLETTVQPKLIRPLFNATEGRWCHTIPGVTKSDPQGKKITVRRFNTVDAEFSQWLKNNTDPMWALLDQADQCDQSGNRRDFPVRPVNMLPVWDYSANDGKGDVKIAKGGNQFFEEMIKWADTGHNVTECDWMCWFEGSGRTKKYKTMREREGAFQCQVDPVILQNKCREAMAKAFSDLRPFKTEEEMIKFIHGQQVAETTPAVGASVQQQMPGYQPGGNVIQPQLPGGVPSNMPVTTQQHVQVNGGVTIAQPTTTMAPVGQATAQVNGGFMPNQTWQPTAPTTAYVPNAPVNTQPNGTMPLQQTNLNVAPHTEVANAPVSAQPVYPQPQQIMQPQQVMPQQVASQSVGDPAQIVIPTGKYKGKTLGYVLEIDRTYLSFLKGQLKDLAPIINAMLTSSGTTQMTQQAQPQTNGHVQHQQVVSPGDESARMQLVQKLNDRFLRIPQFTGQGIVSNLIPFLTSTIGTQNFSEAPVQDLMKLEAAVNAQFGAGA